LDAVDFVLNCRGVAGGNKVFATSKRSKAHAPIFR
jgi:hypothetical protein